MKDTRNSNHFFYIYLKYKLNFNEQINSKKQREL